MKPGRAVAITYAELAPDTILTREEVAPPLKVRPGQVQRLGIRHLDLGPKTRAHAARTVVCPGSPSAGGIP